MSVRGWQNYSQDPDPLTTGALRIVGSPITSYNPVAKMTYLLFLCVWSFYPILLLP